MRVLKGAEPVPDAAADAVGRYERAVELAALIRKQWEGEGCPLTTLGGATGRAEVPHPLVTMLEVAERDCERFARPLLVRHRGPEPSAVVQADIGSSPAALLRSVK